MPPRAALVSLMLLVPSVAAAAPPVLLEGHTQELCALAYSPKGDRLASAANDRTIRVWTLADGASVVLKTGFTSRSVAFSADGALVAGRFETGAAVWDAGTGVLVAKLLGRNPGADGTVKGVAFSPDGRWLAVGHELGVVRLWDAATRSPAADFARPGKVAGLGFAVTALAFSPDSQRLAVGSLAGLAVWNVAAKAAEATPDDAAQTVSVAFTPDGTRLLVNEVSRVGGFRVLEVGSWKATLAGDRNGPDDRFLSNLTPLTDSAALGVNGDGRFESFDLDKGLRTGGEFATPYKYGPGGFAVSPDRRSVAHYFGGNRYAVHVQPLPPAK